MEEDSSEDEEAFLKDMNIEWNDLLKSNLHQEQEYMIRNIEEGDQYHGASISRHISSTSSDETSTFNQSYNTLNYGASTSSHTGYSSSYEGFKFSSADVTFNQGANTCSSSVTAQSHENKSSTHIMNAASKDENESPFSSGKTIHNAVIKISIPNLKIRPTWTCSKSAVPYFEQLINAYKSKYFTFVYEHLEGSQLVVLLNKELAKFFSNELKNKKSKEVIRALHAIHSLTLNPLSSPKVVTKVLARDNFMSSLFDAKCHYNYGSFCFLSKEILMDILTELFHKTPTEVWLDTYLKVLNNLCNECFAHDCQALPTVCFHAITAYLVIGIEALPPPFYPSLNYYFTSMLNTVSRNNLSNHCLEKVWEKLLLFYEHWVKYSLCYPFLHCLDPSHSTTKFKKCEKPDKHDKIMDNTLSVFDNVYIRNRMKYEYMHVKDGYVPCKYPSVPSFPTLPQSYPTLEEMRKSGIFWSYVASKEVVTEELLGVGYCETCKQSSCSCVDDHIKAWKEQQSDSNMEVDEDVNNVSSNDQIKPVSFEEPQLKPSDQVMDDAMSLEEMNKYYDSLIKDNTRSYSVYESEQRKAWKNIKIPNLSNIFSTPVVSKEKAAASHS